MIVLTAGGVAPFIGMWMMKRWGVLLYAAMGVITFALLVLTDHFKPTGVIGPAVVLVIGFGYFADMG